MSEMKEIIFMLGESELSRLSPREALQRGFDLGLSVHDEIPFAQRIIDACEFLAEDAETVEEEQFWDGMAASALRGFPNTEVNAPSGEKRNE